MSKVPVRFAKIDAGGGKSQIVAVMQGTDSISMAVRKDSRDVIGKITAKYNELISAVSTKLKKLGPEEPATSRLEASRLIEKFMREASSEFDLVAFPESLARDLNLKAHNNEANALINLSSVVYAHKTISKRINWRTFIFIHPAFQNHSKRGSSTLAEDLIEIIDKQAALAYRGNSFAAGTVSRQLFELALKHDLERGLP
jgi:hypothetical protein